MSEAALAVLTVDQLRLVVRAAVREEMAAANDGAATDLLTRKQAAELLDVSQHQVAILVRTKGLPGHTVGGEWRFRRSEVLAWVSAQDGKPAARRRKKESR